jgi:MinD-like ATPase involved in chromosome partitioning or flagellar assembly
MAPVDDDLTPEEAAEREAARRRSSAQNAAGDLARMGIDPRALGLQAPADSTTRRGPEQSRERRPEVAPHSGHPGQPGPGQHGLHPSAANVVPLRPSQGPDLPASGTSSAWSPTPPPISPGQPGDLETRAVPLEFLLGREGTPQQQQRPSASQLARAVTFGMLTPDAADAADREREMVTRVRARQTEPRTVVFLAGNGGVGTTSVAIGVGCVLAALRDDVTTLVSLRPGTPSLGLALAGAKAPNARDLARSDVDVTPLRLNNGLQLLDGPRWGTPVRRADVPTIVDRLGQASAFSLFDVGNDASESGHSILSRADQVVIVSGSGPDGVDGARVAAERAAEIDPFFLDSAIYVVVCHRESALRTVVRAMRETMPQGARIVAVPPEDVLADGGAFDPARVSLATRLAMIDVAGMVALGSVSQTTRR